MIQKSLHKVSKNSDFLVAYNIVIYIHENSSLLYIFYYFFYLIFHPSAFYQKRKNIEGKIVYFFYTHLTQSLEALSIPKFVLHLPKYNRKYILKQMQYKFAINFGTLSKSELYLCCHLAYVNVMMALTTYLMLQLTISIPARPWLL